MGSVPARLETDNTVLMLVDLQVKLVQVLHEGDACVAAAGQLAAGAGVLDLPVLYTEQYPQGLGLTRPELLEHLAGAERFEKMTFSACTDAVMRHLRDLSRPNIIVAGAETHVCVQLTVLDLVRAGYQPFLCRQAVSSRRSGDRDCALALMGQAGAVVTNVESVMFELLGAADEPRFKKILKLVK